MSFFGNIVDGAGNAFDSATEFAGDVAETASNLNAADLLEEFGNVVSESVPGPIQEYTDPLVDVAQDGAQLVLDNTVYGPLADDLIDDGAWLAGKAADAGQWADSNIVNPGLGLVGQGADWVDQNISDPIIDTTTDAAKWGWDNVLTPAGDLYVDNVIKPVLSFGEKSLNWTGDQLNTAWDQTTNTVNDIKDFGVENAEWTYDNVIDPAVDGVTRFGNGAKNVAEGVLDAGAFIVNHHVERFGQIGELLGDSIVNGGEAFMNGAEGVMHATTFIVNDHVESFGEIGELLGNSMVDAGQGLKTGAEGIMHATTFIVNDHVEQWSQVPNMLAELGKDTPVDNLLSKNGQDLFRDALTRIPEDIQEKGLEATVQDEIESQLEAASNQPEIWKKIVTQGPGFLFGV